MDHRVRWFQNKFTALVSNVKENVILQSFTDSDNTSIILKFLSDPSILTLYGILKPGNIVFVLNPEDKEIISGTKIVFFLKSESVAVNDSNIDDVINITTVHSGFAKTLRNQLRNIYEPFFSRASTENTKTKQTVSQFEGDVSSLAKDLDSALSYMIRNSGKSQGKDGFDEEDVSGIVTVEDEVQVWADLLNQNGKNPVCFSVYHIIYYFLFFICLINYPFIL
jgi:hypothetical protein